MFASRAVLATVGLITLFSTASAASVRTPTATDNIWAAMVVVGMLMALMLVTAVVSPSLRRRDEYARRNPEDPDSSIYDDDDEADAKAYRRGWR